MSSKTGDKQIGKKNKRGHGEGSIREYSKGKWTARIQIGKNPEDGKSIIKAFYGNSRGEVKSKLDAFLDMKRSNINTEELPSLKTYIRDWLTSVKINELKSLSYDRLESTIENHIIPNIGAFELRELNDNIIQKELINKISSKMSYSSIKKVYDALNACLKYAVLRRDLRFNPMATVTRPASTKYNTKEIEILNEEEIEKIKSEIARKYKTDTLIYKYGYAYILVLYTGLRMGEALALKWKDVNTEKKELKVKGNISLVKNRDDNVNKKYVIKHQSTTKTKSSTRIIPLNTKAIEALEWLKLNKRCHQSDYVICTTKYNHVTPQNFGRTLGQICDNAGVKHIGVHALRHTFASMLFEKGADVKTVSELLGHSSVKITYDTYIHLIEHKKSSVVNLLD